MTWAIAWLAFPGLVRVVMYVFLAAGGCFNDGGPVYLLGSALLVLIPLCPIFLKLGDGRTWLFLMNTGALGMGLALAAFGLIKPISVPSFEWEGGVWGPSPACTNL